MSVLIILVALILTVIANTIQASKYIFIHYNINRINANVIRALMKKH